MKTKLALLLPLLLLLSSLSNAIEYSFKAKILDWSPRCLVNECPGGDQIKIVAVMTIDEVTSRPEEHINFPILLKNELTGEILVSETFYFPASPQTEFSSGNITNGKIKATYDEIEEQVIIRLAIKKPTSHTASTGTYRVSIGHRSYTNEAIISISDAPV